MHTIQSSYSKNTLVVTLIYSQIFLPKVSPQVALDFCNQSSAYFKNTLVVTLIYSQIFLPKCRAPAHTHIHLSSHCAVLHVDFTLCNTTVLTTGTQTGILEARKPDTALARAPALIWLRVQSHQASKKQARKKAPKKYNECHLPTPLVQPSQEWNKNKRRIRYSVVSWMKRDIKDPQKMSNDTTLTSFKVSVRTPKKNNSELGYSIDNVPYEPVYCYYYLQCSVSVFDLFK